MKASQFEEFFCKMLACARVVELVDTRDLKSLGLTAVPVRLRVPAPSIKKSPSSDGLFLCLLVGVEHITQILREIFFASNFLFLFRVKDKQLMQHVFKIDWVRGLID